MALQQTRIDNSNCICEQSQQSSLSPGLVADDEHLYFILTEPDYWDRKDGRFTNAAFSKSKLWDPEPKKRISVARKKHTGRNTIKKYVIEPQNKKNANREFYAAAIAAVEEIRHIEHEQSRAFCVFDDGINGFIGHAIVGASDRLIVNHPSKNVKNEIRQRLVKCFQKTKVILLETIPEEP